MDERITIIEQKAEQNTISPKQLEPIEIGEDDRHVMEIVLVDGIDAIGLIGLRSVQIVLNSLEILSLSLKKEVDRRRRMKDIRQIKREYYPNSIQKRSDCTQCNCSKLRKRTTIIEEW